MEFTDNLEDTDVPVFANTSDGSESEHPGKVATTKHSIDTHFQKKKTDLAKSASEPKIQELLAEDALSKPPAHFGISTPTPLLGAVAAGTAFEKTRVLLGRGQDLSHPARTASEGASSHELAPVPHTDLTASELKREVNNDMT